MCTAVMQPTSLNQTSLALGGGVVDKSHEPKAGIDIP